MVSRTEAIQATVDLRFFVGAHGEGIIREAQCLGAEMSNLTHESEDCFRLPPLPGRERGLAYYRFQQIFRVTIQSPRRVASSLSDQALNVSEQIEFANAWSEAIKEGRERPPRPMFQESDQARVSLEINGEGLSRDRIAIIDKSGASENAERIFFRIKRDVESKDYIWYNDQNYSGLYRGFHFSISLSENRFEWLWHQIGDRQNRELRLDLYFEAFEHEAEEALYEPHWRRKFFLESRGAEIHGISLHVLDRDMDSTAEDIV